MSKTVELIGAKEADALFARLPIEIRGKKVVAAMRKAGNVVKREMRRRVSRGDPRHKPDLKALRDTLAVKVKQYQDVIFMVAGAGWPAGAHAHLVEDGHEVVISRGPNKGMKTGVRAVAKPFIAPAIDSTREQTRRTLIEGIEKAIVEAGG